jgi:phosphoribosylaminoimidazole-succinocarboxamide synthase
MNSLYQSTIKSLPLLGHGKVRDNYAVGNDKILIVTTDRLSAFDVVMNEPIPGKGMVLNQMSDFWFDKLGHIVPNHLTGIAPESVVAPDEVEQVRGRAVVAKRLKPILVEAVVRGYIIGSGWKDYQATGSVCGIKLPEGLRQADKLPEPLFTPAAKADIGEHDENISFEEMEQRIGPELAAKMRDISIALYKTAADYAATRGIIIADTKFEFGLDDNGVLHLMDEVLTAGHVAAVFRQAVRARLPRNAHRLEQDRAGPRAAAGRHRQDPGQVLRGHRAPHRRKAEGVTMTAQTNPLVGVVMGSSSDWDVMQHAVAILKQFGVPHEAQVISAHRMPDEMFKYAEQARSRGLRAIIAGAGGAAHLPGMIAAKTIVPVLGVPVPSKYLRGEDSLLSIVQMPKGVPVSTFAIGEAGAANAALTAVAMLAATDDALAAKLQEFRSQQTAAAKAMILPTNE